MKRTLDARSPVSLGFYHFGQWYKIETTTEFIYEFEFVPGRIANKEQNYTHWHWIDEEQKLYIYFHERNLIP